MKRHYWEKRTERVVISFASFVLGWKWWISQRSSKDNSMNPEFSYIPETVIISFHYLGCLVSLRILLQSSAPLLLLQYWIRVLLELSLRMVHTQTYFPHLSNSPPWMCLQRLISTTTTTTTIIHCSSRSRHPTGNNYSLSEGKWRMVLLILQLQFICICICICICTAGLCGEHGFRLEPNQLQCLMLRSRNCSKQHNGAVFLQIINNMQVHQYLQVEQLCSFQER